MTSPLDAILQKHHITQKKYAIKIGLCETERAHGDKVSMPYVKSQLFKSYFKFV